MVQKFDTVVPKNNHLVTTRVIEHVILNNSEQWNDSTLESCKHVKLFSLSFFDTVADSKNELDQSTMFVAHNELINVNL